VVQLAARLIRNRSVVNSSPIKGSHCFIEQELTPQSVLLVGSMNGFESCI